MAVVGAHAAWAHAADALAALEAASLAARSTGSADGPKKKRLTAFLEGFSLHVLPHGGLGEVA